jgi:hypothetical protein
VVVKGPALLADKDPYNSVRATSKPLSEPEQQIADQAKIDNEATPAPAIPVNPPKAEPVEPISRTPGPGAPIMKAIPVEPQEQPVEIRRAQPAGPLDEESQDSILKAETPPPRTDLGD